MDGDNVMAGNVCASSNIVEHVATSVSIIISCLARVVVHDCMEAEVSAQLLVMDCKTLVLFVVFCFSFASRTGRVASVRHGQFGLNNERRVIDDCFTCMEAAVEPLAMSLALKLMK